MRTSVSLLLPMDPVWLAHGASLLFVFSASERSASRRELNCQVQPRFFHAGFSPLI